jgi:geranylgeranyl diphosphate synthase, type II
MRPADELRELVEAYVDELELADELGALRQPMRYALDGGGKRLRPVLCLAVAETAGAEVEDALPAAIAIELVHTFSLVHDDLPALDDDGERRGRPTVHVAFGEANAILAGDALLAEALRLALSYDDAAVAREVTDAVLGMIGGQARDVSGDHGDLAALHRLKTGRLFAACVGCALCVAHVPEPEQARWRAFGDELGPLFQIVDDILDGDGVVRIHGVETARRLADEAAERAQARLRELAAETFVLEESVAGLAARTA